MRSEVSTMNEFSSERMAISEPKGRLLMGVEFWSSTEYSGFLNGLIRELRSYGKTSRQRFHIGEKSYRGAKGCFWRLLLRFRQYLVYPLILTVTLLLRDFSYRFSRLFSKSRAKWADRDDVIVVSTNTFFAPLLATYLHPRVVHLVYDLFPESMVHSGKWEEGSWKVGLIRWVTRKTLQRASLNVFLGDRLRSYVDSIHGDCGPSAVIAVGADQALFLKSPKQRREEGGVENCGCFSNAKEEFVEEKSSGPRLSPGNVRPRILYCGNFGNMHDSETLFSYWKEIAGSLKNETSMSEGSFAETAQFVFHCSGPKRTMLEATIRELPEDLRQGIHLGDGLSQSEWVRAMESAEVALITMSPGAETVVMPSKTYSAMMAGQAVLVIAPEASDLVDLIKAADCGWWVSPGDVRGLQAALDAIVSSPSELMDKRERAFAYAHANFGQDILAKKWLEVLRNG